MAVTAGQLGAGQYFQVDQAGSAVAVATPYDAELAALSAELDGTRVGYALNSGRVGSQPSRILVQRRRRNPDYGTLERERYEIRQGRDLFVLRPREGGAIDGGGASPGAMAGPAGVGLGQKPPRYIKPGDVVELGIDGLGSQRQVARAYEG